MEKAITVEDRIRRAEEIYYRRHNQVLNNSAIKQDIVSTSKHKIVKKVTIQAFIAACVFTSIFIALNNEKCSETVKQNINYVLSYNIDFQKLYEETGLQSMIEGLQNKKTRSDAKEIIENPNVVESVGGGLEEVELVEEGSSLEESQEPLSQMEQDAEYIKKNISIIKPLTGVITSRFGLREDVQPYSHTGIDIAANTGTTIIAAIDGVASVVSTEGGYGKHIKIVNGSISTLYAHCNDLYIKEGDYISQGQTIAEVGSTGNSTGPHLHFEIIVEDRYVDPDLILSF